MTTTNPKARSYFSKIVSKNGGLTPRPEKEVNHEVEVEVLESISRVEAVVEPDNNENIVGPSKKNRKRDRSTRRSHSSSRCHRHAIESSSQPLPDSILLPQLNFQNLFELTLMELRTICLKHMIFHPYLIRLLNLRVVFY